MPSPRSPCPKMYVVKHTNPRMTYDAVLSDKKNKVYWCLECNLIVVEKSFDVILKNRHDKTVGMPVTSVKRLITKGEYPKN